MNSIKYTIIDDFISLDFANKLIKEANEIDQDSFVKIHGNRLFLSSSSQELQNLISNSQTWKQLFLKINSQEFLNLCCLKLGIDNKNFKKVDFFNINKQQSSGKKIIKELSIKQIIKYLFTKFYKRLIKKIKFSKIFNLNKIPVELLFDYSIAGEGYYNEVHRDSDSRIIVFLLYLNKIDSNGGSLNFCEKSQNHNFKNINTINPQPGRLVIFLNQDNSYHGVDVMKNTQNKRHFLYGAFTSLNHENPYIKNKGIKTEFNLYE